MRMKASLLKAFVVHGITAPFPMQNLHDFARLADKHLYISVVGLKADQPNLSAHTIHSNAHVAWMLSHYDAVTFV